jgi:hypothetical protein
LSIRFDELSVHPENMRADLRLKKNGEVEGKVE